MSVLAEILLALASVIVVSTVSVVVIARVLYTRIRRSRAVGHSVLRARALLSAGRQHEVLALRLRLSDALASGKAALDLARQSGSPLGDLNRLYHRIRVDGAVLDAQLVLLLSERDAAALGQAVPGAQHRVDQVSALVRRLRSAAAAGLGDRTDDSLAALTDDLDREIVALDAGSRELHTLNGHDSQTTRTSLPGRTES
ncbi:hypothetical protein [Cryobacterium sp.]|uniref:hypothetical protein n=1 Tax=Cryobacterium sp. TaxID=1926290 RepID=UPI0026388396|nr:hypothetical protein [Cryobacterium sp.]MCU1444855.1 hypothetical protein [Cryobacterium sp.]